MKWARKPWKHIRTTEKNGDIWKTQITDSKIILFSFFFFKKGSISHINLESRLQYIFAKRNIPEGGLDLVLE